MMTPGQWIKTHQDDMYAFLRALIALPSTSCHEAQVVEAIKLKMYALHYDEVKIDAMGNIMGRMGAGERVVAFDGHIDTVDVGLRSNWNFDPFEGKEDETAIYGRGAADQTGGFVSALYAGALLKDLNLLEGKTLWVVGSVQEEDCDGLCWQFILGQNILKPELVVSTEPTSLNVYRGQRGRMEIKVEVKGTSAHGSAPERGDNAIYKMADILLDLKALNQTLHTDDFLGKGSLTVSEIFYTSPSRCAVADGCWVSIDRRLTLGESPQLALEEIRKLKSVVAHGARVSAYRYNSPSYKGLVQDVACEFPTWVMDDDHEGVVKMAQAHQAVTGRQALVDKWTFSTNGVAIRGMYGVACVGYGPGDEDQAHAPNEAIKKSDLNTAVEVYAHFVKHY